MSFKNKKNDRLSHFGKNGATRNVYKAVYQVVTFKKRSMTAQPVTMVARKARCHRNMI
jgi:hypothetical protein